MDSTTKFSSFDDMIEGVQIIDRSYRYIYVNKALTEHGKYTKEELLGFTMTEKYPGIENTEMYALLQKAMNERVNCQMDNEFFFPDGSKGYFELRMQPVHEGVIILSIDITQRKSLRIALEEQNLKLQRQNKVLEQFVYIASHDLQEPLRTVISFVELIKEEYKDKLDEDAMKYLGYISGSSERMKELVKGLLDYSRIGEKGNTTLVDCNQLLQHIFDDISYVIKESNTKFEIEPLPAITAYETELRMLFQNLITNAIKYRKKSDDSKIRITAENQKDKWLFKIKDKGIGFDMKYADKIFTIFQRLHLRTEYDGTGIGLAHCKKIVELHGGDIWAESVPEEGSTFYFTIPTSIITK